MRFPKAIPIRINVPMKRYLWWVWSLGMYTYQNQPLGRYTRQIYHSALQPGGNCSAGAAISSVNRLSSKDHELEEVKQILTRLNCCHTLVISACPAWFFRTFPADSYPSAKTTQNLRLGSPFGHKLDEAAHNPLFFATMSLTSEIEQQAVRSLTSVHHVPSPRPSIELRRIKHANPESGIKGTGIVRGDDSEGFSTVTNRAQTISPKTRKRLEVQYACLCLALFLAGWNDGTNGPLIPRIQHYYKVNFSVNGILTLIRWDAGQLYARLTHLHFKLRGECVRVSNEKKKSAQDLR